MSYIIDVPASLVRIADVIAGPEGTLGIIPYLELTRCMIQIIRALSSFTSIREYRFHGDDTIQQAFIVQNIAVCFVLNLCDHFDLVFSVLEGLPVPCNLFHLVPFH